MPFRPTQLGAALLSVASLGLAGCTLSSAPATSSSPMEVHIQGVVHGGQQPVSGSTIQLYAVGTTGYGSSATPLLTSTVTSAADGSFSITGKYTCPTNAIVYVTATGGDAGGGPNSSIGMMEAFDDCEFLDSSVFLPINEATTVAAAFALAPYAVDGTHIGAGANQNGIGYAMENAHLLAHPQTGLASLTTYNGNGTAPQAKVNSLANSLAACINSPGAFSTCNTLFNNAVSSTGVIPTNTLDAAINIAQNPNANVTTIYGLASPTPPFSPSLPSAPPDWVMAIKWVYSAQTTSASEYTDIAVGSDGDPILVDAGAKKLLSLSERGDFMTTVTLGSTPRAMAIDATGYTWIATDKGGIYKLTNGGAQQHFYTLTSTANLSGIAIDLSGNAWVSGSDGTMSGVTPTGTQISSSPFTVAANTSTALSGIAVDPAGNLWFSSSNTAALYESTNTGTSISTTAGFTPAGLQFSPGIAFDSSTNLWSGTTALSKTTSIGGVAASGVTGGGLGTSLGSEVDGLGKVWSFSNTGVLSCFDSSGNPLSPAAGFLTDYKLTTTEAPLRIDASGNIWKTFGPVGVNAGVVQVIGIASPVVTPIVKQASNNAYGTRP